MRNILLPILFATLATPASAVDVMDILGPMNRTCRFFESFASRDRDRIAHGKSFEMEMADHCQRADIILKSDTAPPKMRAAARFMMTVLGNIRQDALDSLMSDSGKDSGQILLLSRVEYQDIVAASDMEIARELWFDTARDFDLRADMPPAALDAHLNGPD